MPLYMYAARDSSGAAVQGHQEAPSEAAVVSILQNKGLYVTHVINTAAVVKNAKAKKRKLHGRIKSSDLLFFIAQTANLLAVGIPFVRSMEVVLELTESQKMTEVIQQIMSNIKAGSTFKDSIARHPKVFPAYWAYLIEAGELSGTLPQVMSQLAKNMEASEKLQQKVISAIVYPSVLVTASILAIAFFMIAIVPIFANLFKGFNAELPLITKIVLGISNALKAYFLFIAGGIFGLVFLGRRYLDSAVGRKNANTVLLALPILGRATSDIIHARICIILSMLIRSGLSFLKGLEITANVSGNYIFETAMNNVRLEVQSGKALSASLAENQIFSPMFVNLVKIGEESGRLPEMIEKASEYFSERVNLFSERISVLIEPFVMLFVGGIIGVIGVSIFLPIIRLTSVVK